MSPTMVFWPPVVASTCCVKCTPSPLLRKMAMALVGRLLLFANDDIGMAVAVHVGNIDLVDVTVTRVERDGGPRLRPGMAGGCQRMSPPGGALWSSRVRSERSRRPHGPCR